MSNTPGFKCISCGVICALSADGKCPTCRAITTRSGGTPRTDAESFWIREGESRKQYQGCEYVRAAVARQLERELAKTLNESKQGWDAYYALRKQVAEDKYPGMTNVVRELALKEGYVSVPREPSEGLLMSIALRLDHGLGMPGYYDQLGKPGDHKRRLEMTIADARRAYEEITGTGFWSKERDEDYKAMLAAAQKGQG